MIVSLEIVEYAEHPWDASEEPSCQSGQHCDPDPLQSKVSPHREQSTHLRRGGQADQTAEPPQILHAQQNPVYDDINARQHQHKERHPSHAGELRLHQTSEVKAELFTLSTAYPTPPRMTLKTAPSAPRRQASWKALILPPSFLCSRGGIMDWAHCPKGSPHAARK